MANRVAILGGGVAGMSAAHELIERGFEVAVYEANTIPGGKARSMPVPNSGVAGRQDLPGEHGFRFFPGFYRHLPDTMKRIPYKNQPQGVFDNLVDTKCTLGLSVSEGQWVAPNTSPKSWQDFYEVLTFLSQMLVGDGLNIPKEESWHLLIKTLEFLTSCEERRFLEYEYISWWDFVEADACSSEFQNYVVSGLTRSLVACHAEKISARTGATITSQLFMDVIRNCSDRVLNAPTNDAWFTPWYNYLTGAGVDYHLNSKVERLSYKNGKITGATVCQNGETYDIQADYYIAAVPVEMMIKLVTPEMVEAEPKLGNLEKLHTEWMSGIQFYLDRPIQMNHGHAIYLDSPWALTSVFQTRFWPDFHSDKYGDGNVKSILSICISDWNAPGVLYKKPARQCTANELKNEVWEQFKSHLSGRFLQDVEKANILTFFVDPAIVYPNPSEVINLEPLLINTAGSWDYRPEAVTQIENLFLASDYIRCNSDLATMETANEAARRAVNGILNASGSKADFCAIYNLEEPEFCTPLKELDRLRFKSGLPHQFSTLHTMGFDTFPLLIEEFKNWLELKNTWFS